MKRIQPSYLFVTRSPCGAMLMFVRDLQINFEVYICEDNPYEIEHYGMAHQEKPPSLPLKKSSYFGRIPLYSLEHSVSAEFVP